MHHVQQYAAHSAARLRHSPNTIALRVGYLKRVDQHVPLLEATTDDLWTFIEAHPEWSESTLNVVVLALRSYYRWALDNGHVLRNPAADLTAPRIRRRRARVAADDTLTTALGSGISTVERAMLLLAAECGLRVSEVAKVHRDDRDGDWLYVIGKGGDERTLHLTPELVKALDAIERDTMRWGYYFPSPIKPGRHLTANAVYRRIRQLTGYNTHALRHRAGTAVYRNTGNDLRLTQEFLGHSSPSTTAIYVHVERDDLRRASAASRLAAAA